MKKIYSEKVEYRLKAKIDYYRISIKNHNPIYKASQGEKKFFLVKK
jgi:hypothetical protein